MASNGVRASSVVSSSGSSFVDASGYKAKARDQKAGKLKLKKPSKTAAKHGKDSEVNGAKDNGDSGAESAGSSSPILPEMDDSTLAAFPSGQPGKEPLDSVICKHCKRPVLKRTSKEHMAGCVKAKQEKARKKKEAREAAARAKAAAEKGDEDDKIEDTVSVSQPKDDEGNEIKVEKSAKKSAVKATSDEKKGKKRKADVEEESKEPKKKKKKDEPKAKAPKPKGPVDVERQCGVALPQGGQCARSLTCKSHSMGAKRAVPGRSLPYDMLLQAYQKKNQARQQKAAIDANAPLADDFDPSGPVDSDSERDAVMAAIGRSLARPQPLATHTLIPTRRKYQLVRMKEMLSNALSGNRGAGLFSTGEATSNSRGYFPGDGVFAVPQSATSATGPTEKQQAMLMQQSQNRAAAVAAQGQASRKASISSIA